MDELKIVYRCYKSPVERESKRRIPIEKAKELIAQAEIPVFVVSTLKSYVIVKTEASHV